MALSSVRSLRAENVRLNALVGELRDKNGQLQTSINRITAVHADEKIKMDADILQLREQITGHKQRYDQLLSESSSAPRMQVQENDRDAGGSGSLQIRYDEQKRELSVKTAELDKAVKAKSSADNLLLEFEADIDKAKNFIGHLRAKCMGFGMTTADVDNLLTLPPLLLDDVAEISSP